MAHTEKKLSGKEVFHGRLIRVEHDQVELENGREAFREVIRHPGAVAILVLDGDALLLVRQYRYCIGQELLEIPAGKLEPGEEPLAAAYRELGEETGCDCDELIPLGVYYGSAGCIDERIHLYFGKAVRQGLQHPDEDEFLTLVRLTPRELEAMIAAAQVPDGKTLAAYTVAKAKGLLPQD